MLLPGRLRTLPLAYKCLVLFGGAATLIVLVSSSIPLVRMNALVDEGQLGATRELMNAYLLQPRSGDTAPPDPFGDGIAEIRSAADARTAEDAVINRITEQFDRGPGPDTIARADWDGLAREYRVVRAIRDDEGNLTAVASVSRRSDNAALLLVINGVYVLAAGVAVLGVALLVLFWITNRLILRPVEALKAAAEHVRDGDLTPAINIRTGDEFEELAGTLDLMLEGLRTQQEQLRAINRAMDLRLNELAEANVALYESARVKGEFLANVSHELRTPLNAIIGFAELLLEIAQNDLAAHAREHEGDAPRHLVKRERYLGNIATASRELLALIESLLEMAKIEAGRVELRLEQTNLETTCEGLIGLAQPLADKHGVRLVLDVRPGVPKIVTDPRKLHQILFNLMSNAVKFAPDGPFPAASVTLRAEPMAPLDGAEPGTPGAERRVRLSVIDTGPGIAPDDQAKIFEQFERLGDARTRTHEGTGLGLAICKELAGYLNAELQVVSDVGQGAMFCLVLPLEIDEDAIEERQMERRFRGALSGRRVWVE